MKIIRNSILLIFIFLLLSFSLHAQNEGTNYSIWIGSHYTGFDQYQLDRLANEEARESGDRQGVKPGGKMITHEIQNGNADLGFRRQEFETNLEAKIPGLENVKLFANHRSILEEDKSQHVQLAHCATCHLTSRPLDLSQKSHTLTGGVEVDLGKALVTYKASYRKFQSNANPNDDAVTVNGDLNYSGNYGTIKVAYPLMPKAKVVANGYYGSFSNDPVAIDLPLWRPQAGEAAVDMDWTRYSILSRKELRGNAEFIYQPNFTINIYPDEAFMFFGNYSMTMQEQNFLASVAMMDG